MLTPQCKGAPTEALSVQGLLRRKASPLVRSSGFSRLDLFSGAVDTSGGLGRGYKLRRCPYADVIEATLAGDGITPQLSQAQLLWVAAMANAQAHAVQAPANMLVRPLT